MDSGIASAGRARFCSDCGTPLNPNARFCHSCGAAVAAASVGAPAAHAPATRDISGTLRWAVPTVAFVALILLTAIQFARRDATPQPPSGQSFVPAGGMARAPDISAMSPEERADRLFNRVMRLSTEGKTDSAAFFGPMALGALEALTPLDAHRRYDMGLVALVTGENQLAAAQADTILAARGNHLLGLWLAARAADARGDATKAREFRRRIAAAAASERNAGLPEYRDHEPDVTAAIAASRAP